MLIGMRIRPASINDQPNKSSGNRPKTRQFSRPRNIPTNKKIIPNNDSLRIILQVDNFIILDIGYICLNYLVFFFD